MKKRFIKSPIFLAFLVFVVIMSILFRDQLKRIFIFIGLSAITGVAVFINYKSKINIDFTPVFFFSILFAYSMGTEISFLFILFAAVIPSLISGEVDAGYFPVLLVFLVIVFYSTKVLLLFDLVKGGIILAIIFGLFHMILDTIFGGPFAKEFMSFVGFIIINTFYFTQLSDLFLKLMAF